MNTNNAPSLNNLLYPQESYVLVGLFYKVHNELGRYRNEKQYCDRFEQLLIDNKILYKREYCLPPSFIGEKKIRNRVDFLVFDKIIIDFKAKLFVDKDDYFQMQRYLQSAKLRLGYIVNFHKKYLTPKRIVNIIMR
jgi:GxxExxY protein